MTAAEDAFPLEQAERSLRFPSRDTQVIPLVRGELARLCRRHHQVTDRLLTALALARFQIDRLRGEAGETDTAAEASPLLEGLEIVSGNLQELLDEYGVRVEDRTGQPWTREMAAEVDLRGHGTQAGLAGPCVAFMELPVIYRGSRLLAKGAALVLAPPPAGDPGENARPN